MDNKNNVSFFNVYPRDLTDDSVEGVDVIEEENDNQPVLVEVKKKKIGVGFKIFFLLSVLLLFAPMLVPGIGLILLTIPQLAESGAILLFFGGLIGFITVPIGAILLVITTFVLWFTR